MDTRYNEGTHDSENPRTQGRGLARGILYHEAQGRNLKITPTQIISAAELAERIEIEARHAHEDIYCRKENPNADD